MGLSKIRLGDLIELRNIRNCDLKYDISNVRGVNNFKQLMPTKADLNGRDLTKFQVVSPGEFVFNHRTSRNGSKFSIAYNDGREPIICTEDYVVFRIKEECKQILEARWLYMYFNRPEFDRYVITNSWGSSTEFYNWEDVCSIKLNLPSIGVQKKYVAVYNTVLANQQSYECGLEDLKLTFETLIDEYKHKVQKISVGNILQEVDRRNIDRQVSDVQGINITKQFMPSVANIIGVDLSKYKLVNKGQFAFSGMQTGRDRCIRIALLNKDEPVVISPAYSVLDIKREDILSDYVMMWFSRKEVDRLGWFMSDGSIRTNLDMERFYEIKIPVPQLNIQESIVEIYQAYNARKEINEKLKSKIRNICPILIKGSIEEARKSKEA
jgi:conserved domain protein